MFGTAGLPCLWLILATIVGNQFGILFVCLDAFELEFSIGFYAGWIDNAYCDGVAVQVMGYTLPIGVGGFATGLDVWVVCGLQMGEQGLITLWVVADDDVGLVIGGF